MALLVFAILVITALAGYLAVLMISGGVRAGRYVNPNVAAQVIRGTIYDRNGRALAMDVPQTSIYLSESDYTETIAQILAVNLNLTPDEILAKMGSANGEQTLIMEDVESGTIQRIMEGLSKNGIPLELLTVRKEYVRTYPAAFHASQLIQETERVYDMVLSPNPGYGESTTYGHDIYLALDLDIQYLLDLTVQQVYEMQSPDYAVAFVLDLGTGDLLASTTYPFYNLNDSSAIPDAQKISRTLVGSVPGIDEIKVVSRVQRHGTGTEVTDYSLSESYTTDHEPIRTMVENPDGNTCVLKVISEGNPRYLVFIGSVNPRFYQVSSVMDYALSSLEQGLAAQTKL